MIPFIDLKSQYARIGTQIESAVLDVMRGGSYILGPVVERLEARLAAFAGTRHCVSCASGTDALVMALMAKGVGPGDAVFTVPFTFMASAEAIATVGATPVFVDIEPGSFNMDPAALTAAIAAHDHDALRPRGVLAVDLFGLAADYAQINAIAARHGLFVIEDAAQSFGGSAQNKRAGALAEIGCTSFFPAKPLGCYGDGGAIFCDDAELDAVLRSIRVHGQGSDKYENVRMGITGRLDAMQAAVLEVKLDIFEDELAARQRVASRYAAQIAAADLPLTVPVIPEGVTSAWAQYTVVAQSSADRAALQARLKDAGVPTMIYYPKGLHEQLAFADLGYTRGDFPVTEAMADRVFSLPMHPYLEDAQIDAIVAALAG